MLSRYVLIISVVCGVCSAQAAGQEAPQQQQTPAAEANEASEPNEKSPEAKPKISFEKTIHDFGELDIRQKGVCEFRFKNTGSGLLEIGKIKSTCGCTVPTLAKKQYQPGEDGVIKIKYSGQSRPGSVAKSIYVNTNDTENPKVKLMIKAKVVPHIEVSPSELCFSEWEENAAAPDIMLKSKDGKAFAITGFTSTNNAISIEFDPNTSAGDFVLKPKVDVQKLRENPEGTIKIKLSHPKQRSVDIHYEILSRFQVQPSRLLLSKIEPGKSQTKQILIKSTNGESFEIDSISSKKGYVKVISQQPSSGGIKLIVQVTAPAKKGRSIYFSDDLKIKIKDDETITVRCNGFYRRDKGKS
jgi:hypothetical protein